MELNAAEEQVEEWKRKHDALVEELHSLNARPKPTAGPSQEEWDALQEQLKASRREIQTLKSSLTATEDELVALKLTTASHKVCAWSRDEERVLTVRGHRWKWKIKRRRRNTQKIS